MKNLISMTDFVINNQKNDQSSSHSFFLCAQYAKLLKQPLELWMFVACDENGNVLEEPVNYTAFTNELPREDYNYSFTDCVNYRQAKERVLFEGFKIGFRIEKISCFSADGLVFSEEEVIENLLQYKTIFTLTPTALKQIGL